MAAKRTLLWSLALLAMSIAAATGQYVQQATLFDQPGGNGNWVTIQSVYAPDLSSYSFNDRAVSADVVGIWLLYEDPNFNGAVEAGMIYSFGSPPGYLLNLDYLAGTLSSVRFAGLFSDFRFPSFTLYEFDYFQGEEYYTGQDLPSFPSLPGSASLIITGRDEWTIYDQPNYGGNGICLVPENTPDYAPAFLFDTAKEGIPHNTIQSVRKYCDNSASKVIQLSAGRHGYKAAKARNGRVEAAISGRSS